MDFDEVALNTLLAEGIDIPTAIAGATRDEECLPERTGSNTIRAIELIFAIIIVTVVICWLV